MRISGIETFVCHANWRNFVFVRVDTDEGLHGWGEATLEGKEQTVATAIGEAARYLVGQDPAQIERHYQYLYEAAFWRGGPVLNSAIAGVDQALWDIKGKALGVPVYELLGGAARDRIRYYANGWFHGAQGIDAIAASAKVAVDGGATALKWDPFGSESLFIGTAAIHAAVDCVAAVREAVGPTIDLLIEVHGRLSPANAIRVAKQLERYDPFFYEEPVRPESMAELALVARATSIPIASGERAFSKHDFRPMFEQQAVAYCQPDPCHAGGITALKKIAAMAEAHHIQVAPHNPQGPISTAASIHLAASIPNFRILEFANQLHLPGWSEVQREPLALAPGWAELPTRPGLGIELDEEVLARYAVEPGAYYPGAHEEDGTPANV